MPHVLETLEDAIAVAVATTPTAGGTVYRWRAAPWPKGITGTNIKNTLDELQGMSRGSGNHEFRVASYELETKTQATTSSGAIETCRDALAEITAAIFATPRLGLAPGVLRVWLQSVDLEVEAEGESHVGTCSALWQVEYRIAESDPTLFLT
jgi:hypothetical protein